MQYVTATGKPKHWSNIADGGGKDQLCPMVKPSFWARLSLLVFFSILVFGSPMGGAVPTQSVQRGVTQVADWLPEPCIYATNQKQKLP
jgi:hypothetical protein